MALDTGRQQTLETEENDPELHVISDNDEQTKVCDVQLCRICFATDANLYSMKMDKNLGQAYGTLTGLSIENEDNIPPYICAKCCNQLMNCIHFRNRSLRAHILLLETLREHDCIKLEVIRNLNECQDVNTSNLDVTLDSIEQYNLKSLDIKKENEYTDEQMCLRNERISLEDVGIKKAKSFNWDSLNDEGYLSRLHNDNYISGVKDENNTYNNEGINDEDTATDNIVHSNDFDDDGQSDPDYNILLREKRHNTKLRIEKVKRITKAKTNCLKQKFDDKLIMYDKLCCDMCPFKTVSDVKFLRHIKAHAPTKTFKCSDPTNISQTVISRANRFPCNDCQKTFSTKWGLQKHSKTHSGDKPYTCNVCEKAFQENRDLQNHLRTHSGEKPFSCDLCKKSFSERGNLLRHIRIHAGDKPYKCKVCKISYNQKHHLKRHMVKHS